MFLSLLEIDTNDRRGRTWLANPYRVHQRLLMAFPDNDAGRLLFRIEDECQTPRIVVQASAEADWERGFADHPVLAGVPRQKNVALSIPAGMRLRFLLRANPTVRMIDGLSRGEGSQLPKGKRLGLVHEEQQRQWLTRKGEMCGFRLLAFETRCLGYRKSGGRSGESREQTHLAVDFEGNLVVADSEEFSRALAAGIGSAKGYGYGLLSIGPA